MKRQCFLCDCDILECMGSVSALSFLRQGKTVNELCPKCASRLANSKRPIYPQIEEKQ